MRPVILACVLGACWCSSLNERALHVAPEGPEDSINQAAGTRGAAAVPGAATDATVLSAPISAPYTSTAPVCSSSPPPARALPAHSLPRLRR